MSIIYRASGKQEKVLNQFKTEYLKNITPQDLSKEISLELKTLETSSNSDASGHEDFSTSQPDKNDVEWLKRELNKVLKEEN